MILKKCYSKHRNIINYFIRVVKVLGCNHWKPFGPSHEENVFERCRKRPRIAFELLDTTVPEVRGILTFLRRVNNSLLEV